MSPAGGAPALGPRLLVLSPWTAAEPVHGNRFAREGMDRCGCGAKYWERDHCHSCGAPSPRLSLLN